MAVTPTYGGSTTYYHMDKPALADPADIGVVNADMDIIDSTLHGKVDTSSIVNNLTSTATNVPLSAAQGKALSDTKVNVSDIKNNLTSTDTNKPLSAYQGKLLNDTIATKANASIFANISVPAGSDGLVPVASSEHAILIMVSGWSTQVNAYAWICTGYSTGSNRKYIVNIGRTDLANVTCTAAETGYTIHNGANATAGVHIIYLMNN